jgi:hypothetical protein
MKFLGAFAIVIGALLAVAALLGFLVTPWITIGMTLFVVLLLALHNGDLCASARATSRSQCINERLAVAAEVHRMSAAFAPGQHGDSTSSQGEHRSRDQCRSTMLIHYRCWAVHGPGWDSANEVGRASFSDRGAPCASKRIRGHQPRVRNILTRTSPSAWMQRLGETVPSLDPACVFRQGPDGAPYRRSRAIPD